jgi:hypothetical protein
VECKAIRRVLEDRVSQKDHRILLRTFIWDPDQAAVSPVGAITGAKYESLDSPVAPGASLYSRLRVLEVSLAAVVRRWWNPGGRPRLIWTASATPDFHGTRVSKVGTPDHQPSGTSNITRFTLSAALRAPRALRASGVGFRPTRSD